MAETGRRPSKLETVIGETAINALMEFCGGRSLYIPATYRPGHRLFGLVGETAFLALIRYYGGGNIRVPLGKQGFKNHLRQVRDRLNQEILELHHAGLGTSAIVSRLGVSEKYVRLVKRLAEAE